MNSKVLISLTSIPRRFKQSLIDTVREIQSQSLKAKILINIPSSYKKWGEASPPEALMGQDDLVVFVPSKDYGPATKLLGALEYVRDKPEIDYIITADDDIFFRTHRHLEYLLECANVLPEHAITIGGILLKQPPYRYRDGIRYDNRLKHVHAPSGSKCVVYPIKKLRGSSVPFDLNKELPAGAFNDDDAYFGIVLNTLGIPLMAVPGRRTRVNASSGESAVAEFAPDRADNEAKIYNYAIKNGLLQVPVRWPPLRWSTKTKLIRTYLKYAT